LVIVGIATALALGGQRQNTGDYVHEALAALVYWTKIGALRARVARDHAGMYFSNQVTSRVR
ncbi:MAG TPA: hypothetical protein VF940_18420, partial [Streptosporangiaceae bacterium]